MTAAQAEPPPERNHPLPSVEDFLPSDVVQDLLEFGEQAAAVAAGTLRARGYGQLPGPGPRTVARRLTPYHRPSTGYVMRFPVEPPGEWGDRDNELAPAVASPRHTQEDPEEFMGGFAGGLPVHVATTDAHTLQAVGAMSLELAEALLNLPDVPLSEWHALHSRHRAPRRPGAAREQPGQRRARRTPPLPASTQPR